MRHDEETIKEILRLKDLGFSHRKIAKSVFGRKSKQSTVFDIVKRYHESYTGIPVLQERKADLARVLIFDIETAPMKGYFWNLWKQNIGLNQIEEDWYLLCFSYLFLGENETPTNHALRDFAAYRSGRDCEEDLVVLAWDLLDQADIIVAHNNRRFDRKKFNAKFLEYGLPEPSPYKIVDTLEIAKSNFALTSNKLDYIMRLLLNDHKLETGGFELWKGCMKGDEESWNTMVKYNNKDVIGLAEVYKILRTWDKRTPSLSLHLEDGKERCVACGSDNLTLSAKTANTSVSSFEVLRCNDCQHLNRRRQNIRTKKQMQSTLMNIA